MSFLKTIKHPAFSKTKCIYTCMFVSLTPGFHARCHPPFGFYLCPRVKKNNGPFNLDVKTWKIHNRVRAVQLHRGPRWEGQVRRQG